MKRILIFFSFTYILLSCSNDDDTKANVQLIGNWKLIEILSDPGDGTGTFVPVQSNKKIEFKTDGIITTNLSLCDPYSDELINSGTYSNNTITTNCENPNIASINFEIQGQFLILNYISVEGYSQKFKKIN